MKKPLGKRARAWLRAGIITLCVLAALGAAAWWLDPYRGTTSIGKLKSSLPVSQALPREKAIEDLNSLVTMIKSKHLSAINGLPADAAAQYDKELAALPQSPTVLDVWTASSRILKTLKDAHSYARYYSADSNSLRLDQLFLMTPNGLICTGGPNNGKPVAAVGGVPVDELFARFLAQFSYENIYWAYYSFPKYIRTPEGLQWLGVETSGSVKVSLKTFVPEETDLPFVAPKDTAASTPDFVRFEINREHSLGTLTLHACTNNQKYRDTLNAFFSQVKSDGIQTVALDLRHNGGGNSSVANEFLRYLPAEEYMDYGGLTRLGPFTMGGGPSNTKNDRISDLTFSGKVYVLTSYGTFSSAMWFAVLLRDNGLCEVIGQPPGNRPSAYGDILTFQMPNTKLYFSLTYKQFTRPDASKNGDEALLPDHPVEPAAEADAEMAELLRLIGK